MSTALLVKTAQDNISGFVLLSYVSAYTYVYVAAVITGACAYALVKTRLYH